MRSSILIGLVTVAAVSGLTCGSDVRVAGAGGASSTGNNSTSDGVACEPGCCGIDCCGGPCGDTGPGGYREVGGYGGDGGSYGGYGGIGDGGFGGFGGSACQTCGSYITDCVRNPQADPNCTGDPSTIDWCAGSADLFQALAVCVCNVCAMQCQLTCEGTGVDTSCGECQTTSVQQGPCGMSFMACVNDI